MVGVVASLRRSGPVADAHFAERDGRTDSVRAATTPSTMSRRVSQRLEQLGAASRMRGAQIEGAVMGCASRHHGRA